MAPNYDDEAAVYDETRGGQERARAAADAVVSLVSPTGRLLDVAGGTGIVSAELARAGFDVLVADRSAGMLALADERLRGRAVRAAAQQLPVADACVDVVTMVWLLHLLTIPEADRCLAEAARVLRPGGHLVTTLDKDLAHGGVRRTNGDHAERVTAVCRRLGLDFVGQTSFSGPSAWTSATPGDPVFALAALRRRP